MTVLVTDRQSYAITHREFIREALHYDPGTGIFTWNHRDRSWFASDKGFATWNGRFAGKRAGYVCTKSRGYQIRCIRFMGRLHKEHHLAWAYMTDEPMPEAMDHRNHDATDNRWKNLRPSSYTGNNRNLSMKRNNTSGVTGVTWNKAARKWQAACCYNGKTIHLGLFCDFNEAASAAKRFRAGHGFDPSHGAKLAHYA